MEKQPSETVVLNYTKFVWILGIAGLISAADNWIVSPILPAIAKGFSVSMVQVGIILTAYMVPYGLMQPIYGFLGDRWGKAKILQWIVLGLALGTLGCAFSNTFWMLCVWRVITGFFAAGIIAVSLALIGDTIPIDQRQTYVGKFMGIVFLGQGLSVGLGGFISNYINWRMVFFLFAVVAAATIFFLRKMPKSESHSSSCAFFPELKRVIFTPRGIVIFPMAFMTGFLLLGLYSYLGASLHDVAGLNYLQVGLVVMFYGFACLATGSRVGIIERKIGVKKTVLCGETLSLVTTICLMLFSTWQAGWLATVCLGAGYIFIQSTLATLAFDVASENKGLPSALIGLGLFGGGGLGSACSSGLLSLGGYSAIWWTFGGSILVFMFLTSRINFERR